MISLALIKGNALIFGAVLVDDSELVQDANVEFAGSDHFGLLAGSPPGHDLAGSDDD